MSELVDMAFRFCSRARQKGLKRYEIVWLVQVQLDRLEGIEASDRRWNNFIKGGDGHG